eukprot:TRINITY_DN33605_c0_g1_i1.p1 TRINITY_DN33605_c0_g1~~TRINITY_DN33605_c0_g1_i1.p1  ORF type:complete len:452 (+),score=88.29 TRINITY_DN33605_c0_g1_i1:53-1408(+)
MADAGSSADDEVDSFDDEDSDDCLGYGNDLVMDTSDEEDFPGVHPLQTSFNLAKCMIGEGMLSLAAGVGKTGLAVSLIICLFFGVFMGYTFSVIGRVCAATGSKNLSGCCDRLGYPRLGKTMALSITLLTFVACVSFAIMFGDNVSDILKSMGATGFWASYEFALLATVILVELPLCLIRDMSKLAVTSLLGVACEVGVVIFITERYFSGTYKPGGVNYDDISEEFRPYFGEGIAKTLFRVDASTLVLVSSLATAYIAHFQAPKFYHQLRNRSVRRFNMVTAGSFGLASTMFVATMLFGYLTFGQHAQGNILRNYSTKSPFATASRIGMVIAVCFGFPVVFTGFRDAALESLAWNGRRRSIWVVLTIALLAPIVLVASLVRDLGVVNGLTGSILGSLTTMAYPAMLCFLTFKMAGSKFCKPLEANMVAVLVLLGSVFLAIFGTVQVLQKAA